MDYNDNVNNTASSEMSTFEVEDPKIHGFHK